MPAQHARPVGPATQNLPAAFSPDMVQGSVPSRGRLFIAKPGWSSAQTTHTAAAFSQDMIQVTAPMEVPPFQSSRALSTVLAENPAPQTLESIYGSLPDRKRWLVYRQPPSFFPFSGTPNPFSEEMVSGYGPDRPPLGKPKAVGLAVSQTTPVAAPFTPDMILAYRPERARFFAGPRPVGHQVSVTTAVAAPFSYEMAQGSVPPSARFFFGPKPAGWAIAHVDTIVPPAAPQGPQAMTGESGNSGGTFGLSDPAIGTWMNWWSTN